MTPQTRDDAALQRCDLLFTGGSDVESMISGAFQRHVDRHAKGKPAFSHVAIAIDGELAAEAVPADRKEGTQPWSELQLQGGVRLIPISDILTTQAGRGKRLSILRRPTRFDLEGNDPLWDYVVTAVGAGYSLAPLTNSIEAMIASRLPVLSALLPRWSAPKRDVAALIGLDEAFLRKLEQDLPSYLPDVRSRSFFCSQFVIAALKRCGALPGQEEIDDITPTGLHAFLGNHGWTAVDHDRFSKAAIAGRKNSSIQSRQLAYERAVLLIKMGQKRIGHGEELKLVQAMMGDFSKRLDDITEKISRSAKPI